jgi:hypothetical protein
MQTLTLRSSTPSGRLLASKHSLRLRAFRFMSERHAHRERPSVAAEFLLFAAIVIISSSAFVSMGHAMALLIR